MICPSLLSSIHGPIHFSSQSARYPFYCCIPSLWNVTSLTAGTFIIYSYKYQHDDGRISYPLCFIFSSPAGKNMLPASFCTCAASLCLTGVFPAGCRPDQQMMYAGSKIKLVHTIQLSKVRLDQSPRFSAIVGGLMRPCLPSWLQTDLFLIHSAETSSHPGVFCRCLRSETQRTWRRSGSGRNWASSAKRRLHRGASGEGKSLERFCVFSSLCQTWFK